MASLLRLAVLAAVVVVVVPAARAQNLVTNPDFSDGQQLTGWTPAAGAGWSPDDSDGDLQSGSAQIVINALTSIAISQCIEATSGQDFEFGADVRIGIQGQAGGKAGVVARFFEDASCTIELAGFPANTFATEASGTGWNSLLGDFVTEAGTEAVLLEVRATKSSGSGGATFTANLDDVFLRPVGSPTTTTTLPGPGCADPVPAYGQVTIADALYVLRASVGAVVCELCFCDVNGSGTTSTVDALAVLRLAVGISLALDCPGC